MLKKHLDKVFNNLVKVDLKKIIYYGWNFKSCNSFSLITAPLLLITRVYNFNPQKPMNKR